ncbi:hypothetical protein BKA80DRAFT_82262 [Phyllosticta citrichinensis]
MVYDGVCGLLVCVLEGCWRLAGWPAVVLLTAGTTFSRSLACLISQTIDDSQLCAILSQIAISTALNVEVGVNREQRKSPQDVEMIKEKERRGSPSRSGRTWTTTSICCENKHDDKTGEMWRRSTFLLAAATIAAACRLTPVTAASRQLREKVRGKVWPA